MDKWIHNVVTNNIRKGKIAESDAEIYEYGYSLMVDKIMIFVISVVIALLLDAVWEVLALCITFIPLRVYSGGYHAKNRWRCMVMSGMFLVLGVLGARTIEKFIGMGSFLAIELVCVLVLFRYAPIDVEERRIIGRESSCFKRRVVFTIVAEVLLGIIFLCFRRYIYTAIIMVSNFLVVCSVIGGRRY